MRRLLLSLALLVPLVVLGQTPSVVWFDHDGLDINGQPEPAGLAAVEYAVAADGQDLNQGGVILRQTSVGLGDNWRAGLEPILEEAGVPAELIDKVLGAYRADRVDGLFEALPFGSYYVWARVSDFGGNWSIWTRSEDVVEVPDVVPPRPPRGVRCAILR